MSYDIVTIVMFVLILVMLYIINTILGILINTKKNKFNWKKFNRGMLKAFLFCICITAYYINLEIFRKILIRINVFISDEFITFLEISGILTTVYKKYAVDCYEKIKLILKIDKSI